jgi:hypothetical protein
MMLMDWTYGFNAKEARNAYRMSGGYLLENAHLELLRRSQEDSIKMYFRETDWDCEGQGWMELAQNHAQWCNIMHGDLLNGGPKLMILNHATICRWAQNVTIWVLTGPTWCLPVHCTAFPSICVVWWNNVCDWAVCFCYTLVLGYRLIQTMSGNFQKQYPYCITIKEHYSEVDLKTWRLEEPCRISREKIGL